MKKKFSCSTIDGNSDDLKVEKVPKDVRNVLRAAPSLRPGPAMMNGCLCGDPEAEAIRDAWIFREKVRVVSPDEFNDICQRGETVFHG